MFLSPAYKRHIYEHIILFVPVAISQFGHIMVGVADTIMAGKLGKVPLASATVATSTFIPFLMLGIGMSYGATSLIAKADGAGDQNEVKQLLKHSILLNTVWGILLFLLLYGSAWVIRYLNQPAESVEAAVSFAKWLAWSILPLMVFQTFKQFAEGLSFTRQAMVISVLSNIVNVVLIYILTFGYLGLPALGLNGIAIATLIARTLMAIAIVVVICTDKTFAYYFKELNFRRWDVQKIKELMQISLPVGLQMVLESGAFGLAAIIVGWIGAGAISAHQIALNMAAFTFMGATAISASATVKVGNELGRKDYKSLQIAGYSAMLLALVYMAFTAIFFMLFRHQLPLLYIDDPEVISMASSLLLIAAFFQLSDGLQVVGFGALRGMGDVLIPTLGVLIAYYIIGLPMGYWLAHHRGFGAEGIWYGLSMGLLFVSVFLFVRFRTKTNRLILMKNDKD